MSRVIKEHLFRPVWKQIRQIHYLSLDSIDYLLGRKDDMTPPRRMVANIGGGDFKGIGQDFLPYFTHLAELQPSARVLEVGCGVGRMAVALTDYLNAEGRYEGFDIVPDAITWSREHITPKYQNFHFQLADIYNKKYNPKGQHRASEYRFPYEDNSFDFVFLTSVFTHMLPQDLRQYLSEISRVLKIGKRCLITFFLLNAESYKLIETKVSRREFKFELDGCRIKNKDVPEREVAYEEEYIRALYARSNLQIIDPIHYGCWCGRSNFLSYQDIVAAVRTV